jgi:flagellar biosynthesis component FlhA
MDGLTLPTWMRGANTKALAAPIIIITVVTKLMEDLVPKLLPLATLQKALQNLLAEGIPIRDMRTIVETLAENASHHQDAGDLT